ncbi:MAG: MATE family efflux transporter [Oscillospiraceae bacterium]|nr:MATE family efflux transporter [Oscillospiraceae bacterium]
MSATSSLKPFIKYASLNVLGMLGISCYILADTFFIANGIGTNGLAALNLAIPIYSFIHGCGLMMGIGAATKYTIAKSQSEHQRANYLFTNAVSTSLFIAFILMLVGIFFSEGLTVLLGADPVLFQMTNIYLKVILLFSPFFIANELLLAFVRNDGAPTLSTAAMVSGSIANIILDYIFIYPLQMGIFGAVLATGIAPIISMAILSLHKLRGKNAFHLIHCIPSFKTNLEIMILGCPSLVTELSAGLVMIVFNHLILGLSGNIGVAAYGVIANIALVTTAIYTGIAQGTQPLLSEAFGKGNVKTIRDNLKYAIIAVITTSAVIYAAIYCCNDSITFLFNNEQNTQLQIIAEQGLRLYFTSIPFVGFNIILSVFFTSINHPFPAHVISFLRGLIIVLPMAFILSATFGLIGIWLTITATECITALLGFFYYMKNRIS